MDFFSHYLFTIRLAPLFMKSLNCSKKRIILKLLKKTKMYKFIVKYLNHLPHLIQIYLETQKAKYA